METTKRIYTRVEFQLVPNQNQKHNQKENLEWPLEGIVQSQKFIDKMCIAHRT